MLALVHGAGCLTRFFLEWLAVAWQEVARLWLARAVRAYRVVFLALVSLDWFALTIRAHVRRGFVLTA